MCGKGHTVSSHREATGTHRHVFTTLETPEYTLALAGPCLFLQGHKD